MNIDARIDALTMNLELAYRDIQEVKGSIIELKLLAQQDGENIRGLVRVAEHHDRRLTELEGGAR